MGAGGGGRENDRGGKAFERRGSLARGDLYGDYVRHPCAIDNRRPDPERDGLFSD